MFPDHLDNTDRFSFEFVMNIRC